MLHRLSIVLAKVKTGNVSEYINEIREITYSLYQAKEITKIVYNNIINSIIFLKQDRYYIYEFWE